MRPQSGFSLLELAIVIVILAAILGSVVVPLSTQVQAKKIKETEQLLEDVKEALIGFALTTGTLPCPDISSPIPDGIADPCISGPPAVPLEGFLPWNTLGTPPTDAWGHVLYYGVTSEFTVGPTSPPPTICPPPPVGGCPSTLPAANGQIDLCDSGTICIRDTQAGPLTLTNRTPAVVVSTGPNGLGGAELSGNVIPPPAPSAADERNNLPAINVGQFVLRPYFDDAAAGCVDPACNFDDLVVWLSTPILFNRMVAAGRLP